MKLYRRLGTYVMIGLLVLAVIGVGMIHKFFEEQTGDWKTELREQNKEIEERTQEEAAEVEGGQASEAGGEAAIGDNMDAFDQHMYAINNYRLEHDIPPSETTLWGFMNNGVDLTSLVTLFTIIVAGGIVASEFSWGTVKLLLIRPVRRTKILLAKYAATLMFALTLLIVLCVATFLIGAIFFGFSGLGDPYLAFVDGKVVEKSMVGHLFTKYSLECVSLVMMVTFAFMISTVFRTDALAIGLSIFLMFTGNTLVFSLSKYEWVKYILFANTDLSVYFDGQPIVEGMTLGFSVTVLLIYFAVFFVTSLLVFKKRDVAA